MDLGNVSERVLLLFEFVRFLSFYSGFILVINKSEYRADSGHDASTDEGEYRRGD